MKKMKLIKNYLGILCVLFMAVSCQNEDTFLQESPNFPEPNSLVVDQRGAEIYTVGSYDAVRALSTGFSGWLSMWGTLAADEICLPNWGTTKPIYLHSLSPSNATVRSIWENLYVSVNRTSSAIDRISTMSEDQIDIAVRDRLVGESRFLRAALYFALVTSWENVPLLKSETLSLANLNIPQAAPEEVYDFIIEDLLYAESVLEEVQGGGRATKGAAQALLGKVYLQMTGFPLNQTDKYALAEEKLREVIDSNVYQLQNFYPDIFALDNEQNNEMVFAIGFEGPGFGQGGSLGTFYGPNGAVQNGGNAGNNWFINWELAGNSEALPIGTDIWPDAPAGPRNNHPYAQGYHNDDIRCRNNIAKHSVNEPQGWTPLDGLYNDVARKTDPAFIWRRPIWKPWKWHNIRPSNWGGDTPYDQPYIRYADVLLMYAEALNGQNKLTQADIDMTVNPLRIRATVFPDEIKPQDIAPLMVLSNQEDNANEILSERRKELCFEGWRRNDLIRYGKYQEAIRVTQPSWSNAGNPQVQYSDFEIRWPIPANELQLNSQLVQNPGYN